MAHVSYFTSQYKRVRQWSYVTVGKVIRWRAFYIWKKICIFLFNATHGWERKIVKLSAPKRVHKKLYFSANLCLLSSIGTIHELLQAPWWIKRRNHSLLKCMPIQHAVCVTTTIEHSEVCGSWAHSFHKLWVYMRRQSYACFHGSVRYAV